MASEFNDHWSIYTIHKIYHSELFPRQQLSMGLIGILKSNKHFSKYIHTKKLKILIAGAFLDSISSLDADDMPFCNQERDF